MPRRHLFWLVVLLCATACQDAPLATPSLPDTPEFAVAGGGTDLRSGYDFACLLRGDGTVRCYGEMDEGQPIGTIRATTGRIVQLAAGATHACGLRSDGAVECWGNDEYGQAPDLRRAAAGSYTAVSGGTAHSCALRDDGKVECWGLSQYGEAPALRAPQTGRFTEVNASSASTCALRDDGVIECWGFRERAPAVRTAPQGVYVKLGMGVSSTNCALTSTGVADCWGYRAGWRAGPFAQVVVGGGHTCALRTSGVAECWGYPLAWQGPGDGLTERTESHPLGRVWPRIAAGTYHTCGQRADGYFECFGTQSIGSNAPDVVPAPAAYPVPKSSVTTGLRIRLEWHDVNSNELRTDLERSVADRDGVATAWAPLATVPGSRRAYVDSVATPGAIYVYRVRVCNNAGCSGWDESSPTALPAAPPPAPSAVAARGYACLGYASCGHVSWTVDDTFVETYRIQRRDNGGGAWGAWQDLAVESRSSEGYPDYPLTPGTSYQYRVRTCNARGCSVFRGSNTFVAVPPQG